MLSLEPTIVAKEQAREARKIPAYFIVSLTFSEMRTCSTSIGDYSIRAVENYSIASRNKSTFSAFC
ncbi:MAG: hypothetical protein ABIE03_00820 [Patescibacteria group bacterium]|nr:hypothetical protein [Patescibacteria group bacterium]